MLTIYDATSSSLLKHNETAPVTQDTVWYDLLDPSIEEDHAVEKMLGISVPTRAEMREIEASNRFYTENGATYMTGYLVHDLAGSTTPQGSNVTFILVNNALVTVRYTDVKAFPLFLQRVGRREATCTTGAAALMGLLESIIANHADMIEVAQDKLDNIGPRVFDLGGRRRNGNRLEVLLKETGALGDIVARVQESANSMLRVLNAFRSVTQDRDLDSKIQQRIDAADRDVHSLIEHMRFIAERVSFLLTASLGLISTEQNQIIKLFSVMSVILMPPTLVASIYGMNFRAMPELGWEHGYPLALGLMVIFAIVPYLYFRKKGWL